MPSRSAAAEDGSKVTELRPTRDPFDFPANTKTIQYAGIGYTFRELTVSEMDDCRDQSLIDDKFDGRLMTRLMIVIGATEPTMDLEQLAKVPQRLYSAIVDVINDLNDPESLSGDDAGKS